MCQEQEGIEERTLHLSHRVTPNLVLFTLHLCWRHVVSSQFFRAFISDIIQCSLLILSNEFYYAHFGYQYLFAVFKKAEANCHISKIKHF